jgi:hypothetical protein
MAPQPIPFTVRFWAVGWIDWNLILDTHGGPNHLKNLCDANIIADPEHTLDVGDGDSLVFQASFYYMGHFSAYNVPGAARIDVHQNVEEKIPQLSVGTRPIATLVTHPPRRQPSLTCVAPRAPSARRHQDSRP